ncbi:MAG: TetR/AcrR family transcriptional regulator [Pseudomonadota bacterium]
MTETATKTRPESAQKPKYHHGDLREALISASYDLVKRQGADNFSLADACRHANVSTAAPYRHFKDRDELLAEVVSRGFSEMTGRAVLAVEAHGDGTIEGITAMGQAYLSFALEHEGVFRLMFGGAAALDDFEHVHEIGTNCFGFLIQQIMTYCAKHGVEQDAEAVAARMWTFVHGASALMMDCKYEKVTPGLDVNAMIADATPMLLGGGR